MRTVRLSVAGVVILALLGGLTGVTAQEPSPEATAPTPRAEGLSDYFPAELGGRPLFPVPRLPFDFTTDMEEFVEAHGGDPATVETTFAINYDTAGLRARLQALDTDEPMGQAATDPSFDDVDEWLEDGLYVAATTVDGTTGMDLLDAMLMEEASAGYNRVVESTIGGRSAVLFDRSGSGEDSGMGWVLMCPSGDVLFFVWGYGPKAMASEVVAALPDLSAE